MSPRDTGPTVLEGLLQLGAVVTLYVLQDPAALQAVQLRGWHLVRRSAWWVSARAATIGLKAERRYDITKG